MKKTLSTMAAAAALMASTVAAPVFAQTSPAAPATTAPAATADQAATPSQTGSMAGASGTYLTEQADNQVSANDYIGKSVYNGENNSIGDINDLIFEKQGRVVAAVIGVGGFLGIGEKDVAVPIEKISMTRDAQNNNEIRLTTTETADALKNAPEFKTLDDQQANNGSTDATTTSATKPAMPADNGSTTGSSTMPAAGTDNSTTAPSK